MVPGPSPSKMAVNGLPSVGERIPRMWSYPRWNKRDRANLATAHPRNPFLESVDSPPLHFHSSWCPARRGHGNSAEYKHFSEGRSEFLDLVAQRASDNEIAIQLCLSAKTVP